MNRYPLWKYITVLVAVVIGLLYTLPNFYGESPAVQVSSAKATIKVDQATLEQVQQIIENAQLPVDSVYYEQNGTLGTVRARFPSTDVQLQARDLIDRTLNTVAGDPHYTVALNLLPASPPWMRSLGWFEPKPMYLGLDLRGGVHFLLQVDMQGALTARYDSLVADVRSALRDQKAEVGAIERSGQSVVATFATAEQRDRARDVLRSRLPDLQFTETSDGGKLQLTGMLNPAAVTRVQDTALKQNINTLHNRINELGVAEPVIQQQGADRIIVQLPGVQDVAKAKELLGRTATVHQSKFSMGTVLALIALRGHAGLTEFDAAPGDAEVAALRDKVRMTLDDEVDRAYPRRWIGKVNVTTTDGRRLHGRVDEPKGDLGNTLSRPEIEDKVARLARYGGHATESEVRALIDRVWRIAEQERVGKLLSE